jgi:hypothetical protein
MKFISEIWIFYSTEIRQTGAQKPTKFKLNSMLASGPPAKVNTECKQPEIIRPEISANPRSLLIGAVRAVAK